MNKKRGVKVRFTHPYDFSITTQDGQELLKLMEIQRADLSLSSDPRQEDIYVHLRVLVSEIKYQVEEEEPEL